MTECPENFKHVPLPTTLSGTEELDVDPNSVDCVEICKNKGCSHIAYIYGPKFHQEYNKFYHVVDKCLLYKETQNTTNLKPQRENNEKIILCKNTGVGNNILMCILYYKSTKV